MSETRFGATIVWPSAAAGATPRYGPGDVIDGRYSVIEPVGRGGMGTVVKVEDRLDGSVLALKYCHLDGANRARFAREARIMERITHTNVAPVLASNVDHDPPYLVMPLAERSLEDDLPALKGNEAEALRVFRQVCRGVQALHASGVIHRDLKPANVLRFAGGRAAVADFGLAKLDERDTTALTRTHEFRGTFAYSAPEQLLPAGTREADARTDVCQLGKMLYHMLTGLSPALIDPAAAPAGLAHVLLRATSLNPDDRYRNLGEFLDALRYYELSKEPRKHAREALENLAQQAEEGLRRRVYRSENVRSILGLLANLARHGPDGVIEGFDRVPRGLLPVMAALFPREFLPVLKDYAAAIRARVSRRKFAYAETVARRMKGVFRASNSPEIRAVALGTILVAAVELHRFAAIDVFNALLMEVQSIDLAIPIAEMLGMSAGHYQRVARQIPPDRLHPAIGELQRGWMAEGDSRFY